MTKNIEELLEILDQEQRQMLLDGLDLLDEYYSTEIECDKVLDTRSLKDIIRTHIPRKLIN